jgi:hypothetical protein
MRQARERLPAADELFYEKSVHAVGFLGGAEQDGIRPLRAAATVVAGFVHVADLLGAYPRKSTPKPVR